MNITRRTLMNALAVSASIPHLPKVLWQSSRKMRVLVLGGTQFVGPAIVEAALARGHEVTLFNRGKTNPQLFANQKQLRGDRNSESDAGLAALTEGHWDVVIDTWPNDPRLVENTTRLLEGRVDRYMFVSTISVYSDYSRAGITETSPTYAPSDEHYGSRKVKCERAIEARFPGRSTIVRPGAIVGPRNPGDALRFWVVRMERGGEVLAPGSGNDPIQYTDVNDLGAFVVRAFEEGMNGTFNTLGTRSPMSTAEFIHGCKAITSSDAKVTWVSEEFLAKHQVYSWGPIPLWAPLSEDVGFCQIDSSRAFASGYEPRPLAETARASLDWFHESFKADYDFGQPDNGGIPRARELELLKVWHETR